ncbi:hypothetical protein HHI36_001368 [Cryptolaemus montrouzieri]|uniref:Uncharacterized protein n=1 Tax=Cryptolaemus montrouzieri TaxID=559131 RepID=A0ABD2P8S1_9CUCU
MFPVLQSYLEMYSEVLLFFVIIKCYLCLIIEEDIQPITFKNVRMNLISQVLKTKDTLHIESAENLRYFIIGSSIDTVRINNQVIPTLYENSITDIKNVAVFDLSSNEIQGIEEGAFGNLGLIQSLNLSSNQIRVIRSDVFTNIDVKFLFLGHNTIFKIESGAFRDLNHLYFIDLSYNRIRNWDWRWFQGTSLKGINMKHNSLENLPDDAFKFLDELNIPDHQRILHHLLFDHNDIRIIQRHSFPRLKRLIFLDLSYNYIETIFRGTFDNVETLDKLDLSHNYLMYLDRNVFKHTKVGFLNLKDNFLFFFSLELAQVINLDNNPLNPYTKREWDIWKRENGHLLNSPAYS